jgi:tetratricopeptide (TPR) repeat protein
MATLTIVGKFSAYHGSRTQRPDDFVVELDYEGPIVDGFIQGVSYTALRGNLDRVLEELEGKWLNEIIGRATKERLGEYVLYRVRATSPLRVRIVQQTQRLEASADEVDYSDYQSLLQLSRAEGLIYMGRFDDALDCLAGLEQGQGAERHLDHIWHLRGRCLKYKKEYRKAAGEFGKILEHDPQNGEAHRNLGNLLYELGEHDQMVKHLDRAVELQPQSARCWNNRGYALQALERFEEALRDHTQAIELDPQYAEAYSDRAAAYAALGQKDVAAKDLATAQDLRDRGMDSYKHEQIVL